MMDLVKVSGHEGLTKDLRSNAVINNDSEALNRAKELKRKRLAEIERMNDLESKVQRLESLMNQFLESKANGK